MGGAQGTDSEIQHACVLPDHDQLIAHPNVRQPGTERTLEKDRAGKNVELSGVQQDPDQRPKLLQVCIE
ncbi:hypothetical protein D3C84_871170 [compost metagenome]